MDALPNYYCKQMAILRDADSISEYVVLSISRMLHLFIAFQMAISQVQGGNMVIDTNDLCETL